MRIFFVTFMIWILARGRFGAYAALLQPIASEGGKKVASGSPGKVEIWDKVSGSWR